MSKRCGRFRFELLRSSSLTVFGSLQTNMTPDFRSQVCNTIRFQTLHSDRIFRMVRLGVGAASCRDPIRRDSRHYIDHFTLEEEEIKRALLTPAVILRSKLAYFYPDISTFVVSSVALLDLLSLSAHCRCCLAALPLSPCFSLKFIRTNYVTFKFYRKVQLNSSGSGVVVVCVVYISFSR
ncbi:hypothetical protein J6590_026908 [Homalodisca vitripennis]|nr:hypothetical protein J6590_026908 [Homalodisca vitripennis]